MTPPARVGLKRKRPLPSRTWEGPLVTSARRYSERPPPPTHRSPRLIRPRALLRRRTLARCIVANLERACARCQGALFGHLCTSTADTDFGDECFSLSLIKSERR